MNWIHSFPWTLVLSGLGVLYAALFLGREADVDISESRGTSAVILLLILLIIFCIQVGGLISAVP